MRELLRRLVALVREWRRPRPQLQPEGQRTWARMRALVDRKWDPAKNDWRRT